jgi:flagellar biosynthesis protein FlhG
MPEIFPIGGGKGGVGKSYMVASLGALFAMRGWRVGLVDLDLGASNLHTILGITKPGNGLEAFINKQVPCLDHVAVPTHIAGLSLISSCQCSMEIANLYHAQKIKVINAIAKLPFDYLFLDLGAGTNFNTIDFFTTSNRGVVICSPEPTAIENTFRFIRAVYLRRLKQIVKKGAFNYGVKNAVFHSNYRGLTSGDIFKLVEEKDPEKVGYLKEILSQFEFNIIINQYRKTTDPALGHNMAAVCNRHFYSPFRFIGHVGFDERVHDAVYQKKLFVELYPNTSTSADIKTVARELSLGKAVTIRKRNHHENIGSKNSLRSIGRVC